MTTSSRLDIPGVHPLMHLEVSPVSATSGYFLCTCMALTPLRTMLDLYSSATMSLQHDIMLMVTRGSCIGAGPGPGRLHLRSPVRPGLHACALNVSPHAPGPQYPIHPSCRHPLSQLMTGGSVHHAWALKQRLCGAAEGQRAHDSPRDHGICIRVAVHRD